MANQRPGACVIALAIFSEQSCVDPVQPEFEYREGPVYVDALDATPPGSSYVSIAESVNEFGFGNNSFVTDASIFFISSSKQLSVSLAELEDSYIPPEDFKASKREQWELQVILPDGREYRSLAETVREAAPVNELQVVYDPHLLYRNDFNRFVPGHSLSVSFDDPAEADNYYWSYRTLDKLVVCKVCFNGIFRNDICESNSPTDDSPGKLYYNACEKEIIDNNAGFKALCPQCAGW